MLLKITEELKINIKKECLVTFIKNNFCTYIAQSFLTEGTEKPPYIKTVT